MTATSVTKPMLAAIIAISTGSRREKCDAYTAMGRLPFAEKRRRRALVPSHATRLAWNTRARPALALPAKPRAPQCRDPIRSPINHTRSASCPKSPRTARGKIRRALPARSRFRNPRRNRSTIRRPARDDPATPGGSLRRCEARGIPVRRRRLAARGRSEISQSARFPVQQRSTIVPRCAGTRISCHPRALRLASAVCFHCARLSAMIFVDFVAAWLMCAYSVISRWTRWPSFCR